MKSINTKQQPEGIEQSISHERLKRGGSITFFQSTQHIAREGHVPAAVSWGSSSQLYQVTSLSSAICKYHVKCERKKGAWIARFLYVFISWEKLRRNNVLLRLPLSTAHPFPDPSECSQHRFVRQLTSHKGQHPWGTFPRALPQAPRGGRGVRGAEGEAGRGLDLRGSLWIDTTITEAPGSAERILWAGSRNPTGRKYIYIKKESETGQLFPQCPCKSYFLHLRYKDLF